jgi:hypothetical protein
VARGILRRFLQRGGDLLRRAVGEQAGIEIEGMIVGGDLCGPFLGGFGHGASPLLQKHGDPRNRR